ncbi:XIAP-associated factor 1 [Manis javanica]|nr:XIAP-associated factor 1 [Manis javanica]
MNTPCTSLPPPPPPILRISAGDNRAETHCVCKSRNSQDDSGNHNMEGELQFCRKGQKSVPSAQLPLLVVCSRCENPFLQAKVAEHRRKLADLKMTPDLGTIKHIRMNVILSQSLRNICQLEAKNSSSIPSKSSC